MQAIYERSGGVPRTISVICDNALVSGFAAETTVIGADMIREVCDDFDLRAPFSAASEATRPGPVVAETKAPPVPALPTTPKTVANDPADRLFASYGKRKGFSFF